VDKAFHGSAAVRFSEYASRSEAFSPRDAPRRAVFALTGKFLSRGSVSAHRLAKSARRQRRPAALAFRADVRDRVRVRMRGDGHEFPRNAAEDPPVLRATHADTDRFRR